MAANILDLNPVKAPWVTFLPSSSSSSPAASSLSPPSIPQHSHKYLAHKEGQVRLLLLLFCVLLILFYYYYFSLYLKIRIPFSYRLFIIIKGNIVAVPGLESSFLMQTSDTTLSSSSLSFSSPPEDIAAVMVAATYFTMMEGPFWRSIRGGGLAYLFNLFI